MEQFLYIRKSISNIQKALRVSSHAEPEILMISPGFIFRQEGTNELSAVFHSMKIIPQKISLSNWFFYFNEMVSYFLYSILPGNIFRKHLLP